MSMRITKTVGQYYIGAGALEELPNVLNSNPDNNGGVAVYLIDHFFADGQLAGRLPLEAGDKIIYVDTTNEPTTEQLDSLTDEVRNTVDGVNAVVGIGGGCALDLAKGMSNLLANGGVAADYQGWDLVKVPGIFKVGIPTLSGTGAEGSRTCVLMNHEKNLKLGMNSDFTVFDRLVLDPDLTETVPDDQYFYTGMDTYIHCIESLRGSYRNAFADACSNQALAMCREIFLSGDMKNPEFREKLMVASFLGGSAIGNSYVGLVHPLSAGLSMVLKQHHCVANCIVMNVMDEFYPQETDEFRAMAEANGIAIPTGVCAGVTEEQMAGLYDASIVHSKPLSNALGDDFQSILTRDKVAELFMRM